MTNYIGTLGNDTLTGTAANDSFFGTAGNDTISGGGGSDFLYYGPSGSYAGIAGPITINFGSNLYSGTVTKSGGLDTFTGIRGIVGTSASDTIFGSTNTPSGARFSIVLVGGAGNDRIDGKSSTLNEVNYGPSTSGVSVNLLSGTASDGQGGTDTLINVVRVKGGNFSDTIVGGNSSDLFDGSRGNDSYDGGIGGNILSYGSSEYTGGSSKITVTAGSPTAGLFGLGTASVQKTESSGVAGTDSAININQFRGTDGADIFSGTSASYSFYSYRFRGDAGNDTIDGKSSTINRADYTSANSAVTVDLAAGYALDGLGGTDTLINVRGVQASSFNDTLLGGVLSDTFVVGALGSHLINGRGGANSVNYTGLDNITIDLGTVASTDGFGGYQGTITKASGTDTLVNVANAQGGSGNDTISGTPDSNFMAGGPGNNALDGRDGYDTLNYQAFAGLDAPPAGVTVNLGNGLSGTATNPWGGTDTLVSIEGASGTQLADDLTGAVLASGANSYVRGEGGNDTIRAPSAGTHVTADYSDSLSGVTVNLGTGVTSDDGWFGGTDTLVNIVSVRGSNFVDALTGSSSDDTIDGGLGNDTLVGGNGNDLLTGGGGADLLDGGAGYDQVLYTTATQGIIADLSAPATSNTGDAAGDTYIGIEGLGGSQFGDLLIGGATSTLNGFGGDDNLVGGSLGDYLFGDDGNDNLYGGGSGDYLSGGNGFDAARYDTATSGVTAVLINSVFNTGDAAGDVYAGIEAVVGSGFSDVLIGDNGSNLIAGQGGNDFLDGYAGNDLLYGGAGADIFSFKAGSGQDVVGDFTPAGSEHDTILIGTNVNGSGIVDYASLQSHLSQSGADVLIDLGAGNSVLLQNVQLAQLTASDFAFG